MLNRLLRIIVGLLILAFIPLVILFFVVYWIITGENFFDKVMNWIIFGKYE